MNDFDLADLKKLYIPAPDSHKGQNGRLLIIGGSKLFHAASLWSLKIASRIVDMVFYSSIPENNEIVQKAKEEFRDGIIVPRDRLTDYVKEADCILIGPGLPRKEGEELGDDDTKELTERLLKNYPDKKWVIDGGSLQTMDPEILKSLKSVIITPHKKEFEKLFNNVILGSEATPESRKVTDSGQARMTNEVLEMAKEFKCTILLKGPTDIICSSFDFAQDETHCVRVSGGNSGMTKGGTGDVLAGLVAALNCKNEAFLAAKAGSFFNKKAGESLFERMGLYYNASDLIDELPNVMKRFIV